MGITMGWGTLEALTAFRDERSSHPLKWLELSVKSPSEFVEPLSEIFYRYGHRGVALEMEGGYSPDEGEAPPTGGWVTLKTYLPINSTTRERRSRIDIGVSLVAHVSPISGLQERELDEEEWENSWKEHFHPLRVGKRIVVCPTWHRYSARESDIVLLLDPGMAFGTGHHPTTRVCLELVEELAKPGISFLDVGCGSGILSIAAVGLGAGKVFSLDIDSVAAKVAKENMRENGVGPGVRVVQGTLPHQEVLPNTYDLVVANISAKVVSEMADDLLKSAAPGGSVIVSGVLVDNRDRVELALSAAGGIVERTLVDDDWVTVVASKA